MQGVCGFDTGCFPYPFLTTDANDCCSGVTVTNDDGSLRCAPGNLECKSPADCQGGGQCRGFMCPGLYTALTGCTFP
jgi:hypothetical protein